VTVGPGKNEVSDSARLIEALSGATVACVGDLMLDRFIYGSVDRVSPEAPIPVLRVERESAMIGGAGNVAANVAALGARCLLTGVVGDDEAGERARELIARAIGRSGDVIVEPGRPTTVKTRLIAGRQQLLRADQETTRAVSSASIAAVISAVRRDLPRIKALILSDYGKGVLQPDTVQRLIELGWEAGIPVIVDPKGKDYGVYRGASVVTPNRKELSEAAGMAVDDDASVVAACRRVIEASGVMAVVATRSERGMTVVTATGGVDHLPAQAREVFDVSGAGDTVVAVLAAALATGAPLTEAARVANLAGGVVVGKVGTAVVRASELLDEIHERAWRRSGSKVQDVPIAVETLERRRAMGERIGFTNGCFDLLHPGHLSLLRQAKAECDVLVVGLNSDASVRRLKGPSRPVRDQASRAVVLAALSMVDLIVIFDEDTPEKLIKALAPDVLVKGADYTVDKVVGADFVLARGGRVVLAELVPGQSTTATIERMTE